MIKVKDSNNLVRDPISKAIINTDEIGLLEYKKKKDEIRKRNELIRKNSEDISELKEDMNYIKEMLKQLLEKS